jgi:hypothetical protein
MKDPFRAPWTSPIATRPTAPFPPAPTTATQAPVSSRPVVSCAQVASPTASVTRPPVGVLPYPIPPSSAKTALREPIPSQAPCPDSTGTDPAGPYSATSPWLRHMNSYYTTRTNDTPSSPPYGKDTASSAPASLPLPPPPSNRRTPPYPVVLETLVPAKKTPAAKTFYQPTIYYGLTPVPTVATNTTTDTMDGPLNRFASPNRFGVFAGSDKPDDGAMDNTPVNAPTTATTEPSQPTHHEVSDPPDATTDDATTVQRGSSPSGSRPRSPLPPISTLHFKEELVLGISG